MKWLKRQKRSPKTSLLLYTREVIAESYTNLAIFRIPLKMDNKGLFEKKRE